MLPFLIKCIETVAHKDFVKIFLDKCLLAMWEAFLLVWNASSYIRGSSRAIPWEQQYEKIMRVSAKPLSVLKIDHQTQIN